MRLSKIGVLTFHRCINYGSYWQARCLVEGLRARGHDAVLLDHHSAAVNRDEWRVALWPDRFQANTGDQRQIYAIKARKFFSAFEGLPLSKPFPLHGTPEEPFDYVVVGSDEVWNLQHPWYGGEPLFWGEGLAARRISYAASFGSQSAEAGLSSVWAERLQHFDAISVRDENSRRLVAGATGEDPPLVLDPCLQFPELIVSSANLPERESYVAVYGHGFPGWFTDAVRRWASNAGHSLVSIGYRNDWADEQWIDAGPDEFAAFMAASSAVVTNFFHGCVFALLNGKPLATAPSDYRFNKVRDLTTALAAQRHMVSAETSDETYAAILGVAPDAAIARNISRLRAQSNSFLDAVLS